MPYVAKDDILIYLENTVTIGQGVSTNIKLTLYKDFVGNQIDLRRTGSLKISLFNSAGKRLVVYNYPNLYAEPIKISYLWEQRGEATFTISKFISSNLLLGDIYAEVVFVDTRNYFPTTKTYRFEQFKIGTVVSTGIPPIETETPGDILVSSFNISSVTGSNPLDAGNVSVNSSNPSQTTSIIFNNTNENSIRIDSLENFLTNRLTENEEQGIITLIDGDSAARYAVYNIVSWERIDLNGNNLDSDFGDAIRINLEYEDASSSPVIDNLTWIVGKKISYQLESYTAVGNLKLDIVGLRSSIENQSIESSDSIDSLEVQVSTTQGSITSVQSDLNDIEIALTAQINSLIQSINELSNTVNSTIENAAPNVILFSQVNETPNLSEVNFSPTGIVLTNQPAPTTFIKVNINGFLVDVGNGLRMQWPCYFSNDGGIMPKRFDNLEEGDQLYWNAIVAGYGLDSTDTIDISYQIYR
jgi:hypothetical protein